MTDEEATESAAPQSFPPADFSMLLSMFSTQAMVSLGLIPNPATGEAEEQLDLARHFIDLISVLEEKTKGNLDTTEASALDATLHQLRMTFLQKSKTS